MEGERQSRHCFPVGPDSGIPAPAVARPPTQRIPTGKLKLGQKSLDVAQGQIGNHDIIAGVQGTVNDAHGRVLFVRAVRISLCRE